MNQKIVYAPGPTEVRENAISVTKKVLDKLESAEK